MNTPLAPTNTLLKTAVAIAAAVMTLVAVFSPPAAAAAELQKVDSIKERSINFSVEDWTPDGGVTIYSGLAFANGTESPGFGYIDTFQCDEGEQPLLFPAPPGVAACDYLEETAVEIFVEKITVNKAVNKAHLKGTMVHVDDGTEVPFNLRLTGNGLLEKQKVVDTYSVGNSVSKIVTNSKGRPADISGKIDGTAVSPETSGAFINRTNTNFFDNGVAFEGAAPAARSVAELTELAGR